MKRAASILLVSLMIIGMIVRTQAVAQENDLEGLIARKVNIVYQITGTTSVTHKLACEGIIVGIKENWIIVLIRKKRRDDKYVWCYIPTIRKIEILDEEYEYKRR